MKLLFLIRQLNEGGAQRQLVEVAKGLAKDGHHVTVLTFYPGGRFSKSFRDVPICLCSLNKKGRWDVFGFLWKLSKLLRNEKPAVLHGYLPVPNLLTILFKPFSPHIKMVWGVRASNMDLKRYDWLARVIFRATCYFSCFADLIIINSNAGKAYHVKHGYPVSKMLVIPNGIDTDCFRPDSDARARVRQEWGIGNNEKLIGLVGRLDPMKDHPTFLKAAALLVKEYSGIHFVCVGDGAEPYRSELHRLADRLGLGHRFIWAGNRTDMPSVYNALDILSSSSYGEGFPNVIGEAMACGVLCVVTDVGDSASIVGKTGVVITPNDSYALFKGVQEMLSIDQRLLKTLQFAARDRIKTRFGISTLVSSTVEALRGVS